MISPRRLLVLAGTALALAGCSTTSTFCTTAGCISAVTVTLDASFGQRVDRAGTLRVCLGAICKEQPVAAQPGPLVVTLGATELDSDTADLTVEVVDDGGTVVSASRELTGDRINGPGCPPACYQQAVTFTGDDIAA